MSDPIAAPDTIQTPNNDDVVIPPPPLDLKLKLLLGSNFSLELVRSRLIDGDPEAVALLASKCVPPISCGELYVHLLPLVAVPYWQRMGLTTCRGNSSSLAWLGRRQSLLSLWLCNLSSLSLQKLFDLLSLLPFSA